LSHPQSRIGGCDQHSHTYNNILTRSHTHFAKEKSRLNGTV
jgi:hypothetical protein